MAGFLPRSHGDTEFFYRFEPNPVRFLFRISVTLPAPRLGPTPSRGGRPALPVGPGRLSGFFLLSLELSR
jgi:hypothetical protein